MLDNITKEDTDLQNLSVLPSLIEVKSEYSFFVVFVSKLIRYREKWKGLTEDHKAAVLALNKSRTEERLSYNQSCKFVLDENSAQCVVKIDKFASKLKKVKIFVLLVFISRLLLKYPSWTQKKLELKLQLLLMRISN